ncbi:MAG: sigma-70 family RNA polymerase sigma factor [Candidatus Omnitrophica bacterium]|nr:sigma-70 family RNA polymerase sigma factor [Candidatus Omnitrophota bacterium]
MKNNIFEDDLQLLRLCVERKEEGWAALIAKYSGLIEIAIRKRVKKYGFDLAPEDILDIRQNVLESIWKNDMLKTVRNAKSLPYWLAIVSGNAAMQYLRQRRLSHDACPLSISSKADDTALLEFIASNAHGPADTIDNKIISEAIDTAIESLPVKERLIIKLHLIHGKKQEEISGILRLPLGTVCSYTQRAKEKLKKYLKNLQ